MKKFLAVLSILVLVAGFAFASITGSVEAKYVFDFTHKTVNYGVNGSAAKFSFTLGTEKGSSTGENKPYATATVDFALGGEVTKYSDESLVWNSNGFYLFSNHNNNMTAFQLKLSDFRIVGENWEVNFLYALGVGDFAKSAWEVEDTDDKDPLDMKWEFGKREGITITYDENKFGVYAYKNEDDLEGRDVLNFRTESKEFSFQENVKAKAALAIGVSKDKVADETSFDFGVGLKGGYASDSMSADLAVDLQYFAKDFNVDTSVKVAVDPIVFDAYFATNIKTKAKRAALDPSTDNFLSVKVLVDLAKSMENVPVKFTIYGENLVNDDRFFAIDEEGTFGKASETFCFGIWPSDFLGEGYFGEDIDSTAWFINAGFGYMALDELKVSLNVGFFNLTAADVLEESWQVVAGKIGAVYTHEKFTAEANVYLADVIEFPTYEKGFVAGFVAKVSTDKIVENATLSATLSFDEKGVVDLYDQTSISGFDQNDFELSGNTNKLTLSCKVAF